MISWNVIKCVFVFYSHLWNKFWEKREISDICGTVIYDMNVVLCHFCVHIGLTGSRKPPEDGGMNEMT